MCRTGSSILSRARFLVLAALAGLAGGSLAGCGFAPLYGTAGDPPATASVADRLNQVQVQNIPERPGQMLRQALEDQLYVAGTPTVQRYTLNVAYSINIQGVGIQTDTSVTRNRFVAIGTWTLGPVGAPATPLATGTATTEDAENIIDQQPFTQTLETGTIDQQLADEIAGQITTQIAAWFKAHPAA